MPKVRKGDHYNSPFAQNLRALIDEKGTKQKELGDAIGVSRQTISLYADGSTQPSPDKLSLIADFYSVSADYLLGKVKVRTKDIELQQVCEFTGLSEGAINTIRLIHFGCGDVISALSMMLEDERFEELMRKIYVHIWNKSHHRIGIDEIGAAALAKHFECNSSELKAYLAATSQAAIEALLSKIMDSIELDYFGSGRKSQGSTKAQPTKFQKILEEIQDGHNPEAQ